MWKFSFLILPILFLFQGCAKPKATVFEDNRLAQEEMVKICLLGDLGMDTAHQRVIAEALEREDCHRIFFLGDLVYPKGIKSLEDPVLEQRFLSYYSPLLEKNPNLEINLMLGNHDHQGDPSAWKDVSKAYPGLFFPHYYYFIDYGGLCMVALDTSFYYYKEHVAEAGKQSKWVTELNSRLKDCEVKIAMSHHPLKGDSYSGSKDWKGAEGLLKAFLETYVIGKFDMHITGHVHILADDGKDEGTRLLISGTGGETRGDGPAGYVVLNWDPQNPKRIGYLLRQIDIETYVYNEQIEQEESGLGSEESENLINKTRVEEFSLLSFLRSAWDSLWGW